MKNIIEVTHLKTHFGNREVHKDINLSVKKGEIYGLLGHSGCGKTTLMRKFLMLEGSNEGEINILGYDLHNISSQEAQNLRLKWGVLFQQGALFSSLSLYDNIALPLYEYSDLDDAMIEELVRFKLDIVGLKQEDAYLFPSQISGGMRKKTALARALVMDPELLFLDEPTSGLDPVSAREFDALIVKLKEIFGLTIVMISHDLESIYSTLDRVGIIENGLIAYEGDLEGLEYVSSPFIQTFFKDSEKFKGVK